MNPGHARLCGPLLALAWAKEASVPGWGWAGLRSERGHLVGKPSPRSGAGQPQGERAQSRSVRQETEREINKHMGLEESPSRRVSRKNTVPGQSGDEAGVAEGLEQVGEVGYPTSVFFLWPDTGGQDGKMMGE